MADNKEKETKQEEKKDNKKPKREFLLNKNVSAESVEPIIKGILEVNEYDREQKEKDENYVPKPIRLVVDSYGGDIYSGNALVAIIDSSETPVWGYCYGKAMSMGFMIYNACHKRFAHMLACLMYHDAGSVTRGFVEEMQMDIDQVRKLIRHGDTLLLANTKLTRERLDEVKKTRTNWYMFADEAMQYGVVHEIIKSTRK